MKKSKVKRNLVLGILFFLPVVFLLFLYPSTHHYNPLDIVNANVSEVDGFSSTPDGSIGLKDHISLLGFLGENPMEHAIAASNLKELVYDKFKGFKRFQVVVVVPNGTEAKVEELQRKISNHEDLKFWHYVFGTTDDINQLYGSLKTKSSLNADLSTDEFFIIDKDLNQRGRLDDRSKKQKDRQDPVLGLSSYNSIDIDEIKNKMGDDMRVLFTEYRQKRKGTFDSSARRSTDLNFNDEQEN